MTDLNLDDRFKEGLSLAQTGRFAEAVPHLEAVYEQTRTSFAAAYWLSVAYKKLGRANDAVEFSQKAAMLEPLNWRAREHLGFCFQFAGRFVEAEQCFRAALANSEERASVWGGLGLALKSQGRAHESGEAFRRGVAIDPNSFPSHLHLAEALTEERSGEEAVHYAKQALKLRPNACEAELTLAGALVAADRAEEADEHLMKAMTMGADPSLVYSLSGEIKQILGQMDEAEVQFRKALEVQETNPRACLGIVSGRRVNEGDISFVESMKEAANNPALDLGDRFNLHFAIGKALEDLGQYGDAIRHFDEGNRAARALKFGNTPFDYASLAEETDVSIGLFTPEFMEQHRDEGSDLDLPILVVGMLRSGTTLVEQILSSHPQITGAGEQSFWTRNLGSAFEADRPVLVPGRLRELGQEYCETLRRGAPAARHIVDKMPSNYSVLAPIHLSLPNARIIHVRRHPVDTCVSIYTTPNSARMDWAHDRENITLAYEEYLRFMRSWRDVISADCMLEVDYEDLATDPESVTRRMVEFCGLEWDDACLRFHESKRSVATPSVWQVRQPMYKTSVERWKRYEPWLGPFARLGSQTED